MVDTAKSRNQYGCFVCAQYSEAKPGLCAIGMHKFADLVLNEKKTKYRYPFGSCFAHLDCIQEYLHQEDLGPEMCVVCKKKIKIPKEATKFAIYPYRKRGCYAVMSIHDECYRKIGKKSKAFIIKTPYD